MASGTVKKINENGFGFITPGEGKDIFFHASGMAERGTFDNLQVGDRVTYEIDNSGDRPRAINVKPGG
jgi:CspA family cold shock protein